MTRKHDSLNRAAQKRGFAVLNRLMYALKCFFQKEETSKDTPVDEGYELCCNGIVHISYRGVSDDRLYITYHRKWAEVKFFRQNNLRVFCADCRRRLL